MSFCFLDFREWSSFHSETLSDRHQRTLNQWQQRIPIPDEYNGSDVKWRMRISTITIIHSTTKCLELSSSKKKCPLIEPLMKRCDYLFSSLCSTTLSKLSLINFVRIYKFHIEYLRLKAVQVTTTCGLLLRTLLQRRIRWFVSRSMTMNADLLTFDGSGLCPTKELTMPQNSLTRDNKSALRRTRSCYETNP